MGVYELITSGAQRNGRPQPRSLTSPSLGFPPSNKKEEPRQPSSSIHGCGTWWPRVIFPNSGELQTAAPTQSSGDDANQHWELHWRLRRSLVCFAQSNLHQRPRLSCHHSPSPARPGAGDVAPLFPSTRETPKTNTVTSCVSSL